MVSFPGLEWFEKYASALQLSVEFKSHCRWLRTRLAFVVDRSSITMAFDRGLITEIVTGYSKPDIAIIGSATDWDCLITRDQTLLRLYRSGQMEIRGDNVMIMHHWKALFFVCEGMKTSSLTNS